ncbi:MAG: hypothetical protein ACT4PY_16395 [Armatimonadota bacterium]
MSPEQRDLWRIHLADQVSVIVEQQLAEDVAWAEGQGFDADVIRRAARLGIGSGIRLHEVLEIYRKDEDSRLVQPP